MKKTGVKNWEAETVMEKTKIVYQIYENAEGAITNVEATLFDRDGGYLGNLSKMKDGGLSANFGNNVSPEKMKESFALFVDEVGDLLKNEPEKPTMAKLVLHAYTNARGVPEWEQVYVKILNDEDNTVIHESVHADSFGNEQKAISVPAGVRLRIEASTPECFDKVDVAIVDPIAGGSVGEASMSFTCGVITVFLNSNDVETAQYDVLYSSGEKEGQILRFGEVLRGGSSLFVLGAGDFRIQFKEVNGYKPDPENVDIVRKSVFDEFSCTVTYTKD